MSQQPKDPQVQYVDLPDVPESFADSIQRFMFDGNTLRLVFAVNRFDDAKPPNPPTLKAYTAVRLVLTVNAANDLQSKLNGLAAAIQESQKKGDAPPATVQ